MTMQIKAMKYGKRGEIRIVVRKQDNDGNAMSNYNLSVNDKRIARVLVESFIHANPRVGKIRIKWEV